MKDMTRREFISKASRISGMSLGMFVAGSGMPLPATLRAVQVGFPEKSWEGRGSGAGRTLVAYDSKCGTTGEIAVRMGEVIAQSGAAVDVLKVQNVSDLSQYRAVIVGSAVHGGKWLSGAMEFVAYNQETLCTVPVAYFLACYTMRDPTSENRRLAMEYMQPTLEAAPSVEPVATGLFAGVVDYSRLSFLTSKILQVRGVKEGDFRDWGAIMAWAGWMHTLLGIKGGV